MNQYEVIKRPIVTEKSSLLKETSNTYAFEVDRKATKGEIKSSVEELFKVKVKSVETLIQRGKYKRFFRYQQGRTKPWKKAYVTLTEGKIELFEGV